jgi:hypothetical protein
MTDINVTVSPSQTTGIVLSAGVSAPYTFISPLSNSTNTISLKGLTGFGTAGQIIATNATTNGLEWSSAGSGTVTSVSVTSANGISGTVANSTTTPAITLLLGDIVPTTVNGITLSGTGTATISVTGSSSLSGSNTGDTAKTNITGASCTGSDGDLSRTYNLGTTIKSGNIVVVNRATLMETIDYTKSGTTFTFGGVNIYDADALMIIN